MYYLSNHTWVSLARVYWFYVVSSVVSMFAVYCLSTCSMRVKKRFCLFQIHVRIMWMIVLIPLWRVHQPFHFHVYIYDLVSFYGQPHHSRQFQTSLFSILFEPKAFKAAGCLREILWLKFSGVFSQWGGVIAFKLHHAWLFQCFLASFRSIHILCCNILE